MKIRALMLAAALAGLGVTAVTAADEPQAVRQQLMKKVGKATGELSGIAKGEKPYDAEIVKASLATISETVKVFPNHFPAGSETGMETEASPKIWRTWRTSRKRPPSSAVTLKRSLPSCPQIRPVSAPHSAFSERTAAAVTRPTA